MPQETYYEGLLLGQALRKFGDYHGDPKTRHISQYEHSLIERAADRIENPLPPADDQAERDAVWMQLLQVYWTAISASSATSSLELFAIPVRALPGYNEGDVIAWVGQNLALPLDPEAAIAATPTSVHAAISAMVLSGRSPSHRVSEVLAEFDRAPATIEQRLGADDFRLVNRAMYQPALPVEGSEVTLKDLKSLVETGAATASGSYMFITDTADRGPVGVLMTASTIVLIRLTLALADRLSEAIHEWRRDPPQD